MKTSTDKIIEVKMENGFESRIPKKIKCQQIFLNLKELVPIAKGDSSQEMILFQFHTLDKYFAICGLVNSIFLCWVLGT